MRKQGNTPEGASPEKTSNPETKSLHNVFEGIGAFLYGWTREASKRFLI
jgi:hypothetical protein